MADARITEVCDGVVALVEDWWGPTSPDDVSAPVEFDLDTAKLDGRKVWVFPASYAGAPVNRGEDQGDYSLTITVAELYPDAGAIDKAWFRERVKFCEDLLAAITNVRGPNLLSDEADPDRTGLWAQESGVTTVYDVELLTERKLFLSVLNVTYREHADA